MNHRTAIALLGVAVLAFAGCGPGQLPGPTLTPIPTLTPTPTPTPIPTLTPGEQARTLAEVGVTHNADWTPYTEEINGVEMALVPAGCFIMGSTDEQVDDSFELCKQYWGTGGCERDWFEDEQPAHEVCFEEPFWIDVYEVTNRQFEAFDGVAEKNGEWTEDNRPRETITWAEANTFCRKRSARLPTEAEWEYAARGPDGLVFTWGDEFVSDNVVWEDNSGFETWDVGSKAGGVSWVGVYNLSGNVGEWVNDWYGDYLSGLQFDPVGPDSGEKRVNRGGSWLSDNAGYKIRAADRGQSFPPIGGNGLGVRCALSYKEGSTKLTFTPVTPLMEELLVCQIMYK